MSERTLREVIPGRLWQSGSSARLADVEAAGINALLCVGEERQQWERQWWKRNGPGRLISLDVKPPKFRISVAVPLFDASDCLDVAAADAAIALGVTLLGDPGRRLLVHCSAGAFRSVHIAAGIVASVLGMSGRDAFLYVERWRQDPRESLGIRGWHEHVATFGNRIIPTPSAAPHEDGGAEKETR